MKNKKAKSSIDEIIVVEGKNDENAVKTAVEAGVIVTSGFYISGKTWSLIEKAYKDSGIIIFTDPDYAGENIRKQLSLRFPKSKHAYLTREASLKKSDIGIENASPENILEALKKATNVKEGKEETFKAEDLFYFDLIGSVNASINREKLGKALGIGSCNAKAFLSRLNNFGIKREEFYEKGKALFSKDS